MTITISAAISKEIKGTWGPELFHDKVGLPVIKTNNLNYDGTIDLSNVSFRDIEPSSLAQLGLVPGDLLIEKSGGTKTHSVGYVAFFDGPANTYVANNFILTIRPNPSVVLPRFLFHQLRYKYESGQFADCYNKTTGIQNLKTKAYLSKYISLPTMERQVFISNELDLITREINDSKEQIKLLDEQAKSLFNETFAGQNYPMVPLGSCCDYIDYRGKTPEKSDSGVRLITAKNVRQHSLSLYPEEFIPADNYEKVMTRGIPKCGTLLFTTEAPLGFVCRIPVLNERFCLGQRIINLIPKRELVPAFLEYEMTSDRFVEDMVRRSSGSTVKGIRSKELFKILVSIPPIGAQQEFARRLEQIDKLRFNYQKQIDLLNELMEKKMEEYFGGEEDA